MQRKTEKSKPQFVISVLLAIGALAYFVLTTEREKSGTTSVAKKPAQENTQQSDPIISPSKENIGITSKSTEFPKATGVSEAHEISPELPSDFQDSLRNPPPELPPDLKAQLESPPPELPEDLRRQLEGPAPELPDDLKAQLNSPPPPLPDDIKRALATPPRVVSIEEVNTPPK